MGDRRTQLETVIRTAIDTALKEVHICYPAIVTKVYTSSPHNVQSIDAQITIKRKMGGELVDLPLLVEVPIRYPRSATFSMTFPIEVDDHVKIYIVNRSIDNWLLNENANERVQDPFDIRKFSLSDAFAEPVMYSNENLIPGFNEDDLEIKTNSLKTKIKVLKGEGVDILTNDGANSTVINIRPSGVTISTTGPTDMTSSLLTINNNVVITGDLEVKGKDFITHKHGGVTVGGANTGVVA